MLQKIHYNRNELQEVNHFEDKECTIPFDFTNAKNLYIELNDGDITPLYILKDKYYWRNIYTPYMSHKFSCEPCDNIITLNDITPNLSKYIPEDNAVLFLSEEDSRRWNKKGNIKYTITCSEPFKGMPQSWVSLADKQSCKITIFLPHGTQAEREKVQEVSKYLWKNFKIKPNLFALHWFDAQYINSIPEYVDIEKIKIELFQTAQKYDVNITFANFISEEFMQQTIKEYEESNAKIHFNKIITTNSTGVLKPEDSKERLQVIDCFDIFQDHLNNI